MRNKRFEEVYRQGKLTEETGVLYLVHQEGYGMGHTVMVDEEGKPIIDKDFS